MSIEIRKVVREIIASAAVFVPCVVLLASAPTYAAENGSAPGMARDSASSAQTTTASATDDPGSAGKKKLKEIVIVAAEKAVATVNPLKFEHVSPASSVTKVLNNVPGFNARTLGVAGFIVSNTAYTLDGFPSSELGRPG